jgi:hypothetical protein
VSIILDFKETDLKYCFNFFGKVTFSSENANLNFFYENSNMNQKTKLVKKIEWNQQFQYSRQIHISEAGTLTHIFLKRLRSNKHRKH